MRNYYYPHLPGCIGWLARWLDWLAGWLSGSLAASLAGWLAGVLAGCMPSRLPTWNNIINNHNWTLIYQLQSAIIHVLLDIDSLDQLLINHLSILITYWSFVDQLLIIH